MGKAKKLILLTLTITVVLIIGACLFIGALWSGAFNFMLPNEIATYHSPNEEYSLVFEQMGSPEWPFGATDVRLTLKEHSGKTVERISTQIYDDGANASEYNIVSVCWNDDAVVVILRGSEMQDKEIAIPYNKN